MDLLKMAESGWNGCKLLGIAGNGQNDMTINDWIWLKMADNGING